MQQLHQDQKMNLQHTVADRGDFVLSCYIKIQRIICWRKSWQLEITSSQSLRYQATKRKMEIWTEMAKKGIQNALRVLLVKRKEKETAPMMRIIAVVPIPSSCITALPFDKHSTVSQSCNWRSIFFHYSRVRKPLCSSWGVTRNRAEDSDRVRTSVLICKTCREVYLKGPNQTLVNKSSMVSVWYMNHPMRPSRQKETCIWINGDV